MKKKPRRIEVNEQVYLWLVEEDKKAIEQDYILLKIWQCGDKRSPWIVVRYPFHNPWLFYGELISIQTGEEAAKADEFFQFKPITPGKVAEIIKQADILLESHDSSNRCFCLDNAGNLEFDLDHNY